MGKFSIGGGLSGAASGATVGGSIGGAPGAAIGGAIGGGLGAFGAGGPRQPKIKNTSLLTPDQMSALTSLLQNGIGSNPLYQQGSNFLGNLLSNSPGSFDNFQAPYMQNFEQNIAPGIAERFAGMGTGAGGLNSSALFNSLSQAGRNLQTDLAGLHSGLQMQALPQALQYAQQPQSNLLNAIGVRAFQPYERPGNEGFLSSFGGPMLSAFGQGLGQKAGDFFGSKFGASGYGTPNSQMDVRSMAQMTGG